MYSNVDLKNSGNSHRNPRLMPEKMRIEKYSLEKKD